MLEPSDGPRLLGIVGAGAMGSGIAQLAVSSGIKVQLVDKQPDAVRRAYDNVSRWLRKRELDALETEQAIASLAVSDDLRTLSSCDIVVEAIVENLDAKRSLFKELEAIVSPEAILASNTSSLPIGAIAAEVTVRRRIAGLHFFNPVPLMRLVEVIPAPETSDSVVQVLTSLAEKLGRVPIVVRDAPGFLVNLGGRAYTTEALAILHESVATPAQIDAIMRDCCGFRMGPFELMDLTGVDVNFPVTRFVHDSFFGDPRLRSTPYHRYLMETRQLGRKTGRGFYRYDGTERPSPDESQRGAPAEKAYLASPTDDLNRLASELGLTRLNSDDGASPILAAPIGEDATAFAARTGSDAGRLVAVDLSCDTTKRVTIMSPPGADPELRQSVVNCVIERGRAVTAIADSPGFVAQRIVAMVANLGCEMAQTGLANPRDIDMALRLGLNYPRGPLEMAASLGLRKTQAILTSLQALTGDDRYRPSQWLRRRASLDLSPWTM